MGGKKEKVRLFLFLLSARSFMKVGNCFWSPHSFIAPCFTGLIMCLVISVVKYSIFCSQTVQGQRVGDSGQPIVLQVCHSFLLSPAPGLVLPTHCSLSGQTQLLRGLSLWVLAASARPGSAPQWPPMGCLHVLQLMTGVACCSLEVQCIVLLYPVWFSGN